MSIFQKIITQVDDTQQKIMGPNYQYQRFINSPSAMGMSSRGNLGTLRNNIAGIMNYARILVEGSGRASKSGEPLGNKFFLETLGQCKDFKTGKTVKRSMYIVNQPVGKIPGISNITGTQFSIFRGLVPGILENANAINPVSMFKSFMEGSEPLCAEVKLQTIDSNNRRGEGTGYVPISELIELDRFNYLNDGTTNRRGDINKGKYANVVTREMRDALNKEITKENFANICDEITGVNNHENGEKKNDNLNSRYVLHKTSSFQSMYIISIGLLFFYIITKLMRKK